MSSQAEEYPRTHPYRPLDVVVYTLENCVCMFAINLQMDLCTVRSGYLDYLQYLPITSQSPTFLVTLLVDLVPTNQVLQEVRMR